MFHMLSNPMLEKILQLYFLHQRPQNELGMRNPLPYAMELVLLVLYEQILVLDDMSNQTNGEAIYQVPNQNHDRNEDYKDHQMDVAKMDDESHHQIHNQDHDPQETHDNVDNHIYSSNAHLDGRIQTEDLLEIYVHGSMDLPQRFSLHLSALY